MPSCANCGKPSAVKLSYNSTDLCEQCFCRQFENRVISGTRTLW